VVVVVPQLAVRADRPEPIEDAVHGGSIAGGKASLSRTGKPVRP
jgi:hypothetical protein